MLYHGSNADLRISVWPCADSAGTSVRGCLSALKSQTENMAARVARIYGGAPVLNAHGFDEGP